MFLRHWIHYYLARCHLALKRHDQAAAAYRAWFGMGMIHREQGDNHKAVEMFKKAAELQPMNPHAFHELAMAHYALNNLDQVRKIIKRVAEFDPKMTRQLMRETGQLPEGAPGP